MPIYAYKCESCGHSKDVLQKVSDAPLTECPACGKPTFSKQVTAAGFQLKGRAGTPPISRVAHRRPGTRCRRRRQAR
jgi:putative FmdB family regulatory protein